jgi:hypothetical protein
MPSTKAKALLALEYEEAAQAYLGSLPLEHFMESTVQATQRRITLESLDLLQSRRPSVRVFHELLMQYRLPRRRLLRQLVPDHMVVVSDTPIKAGTSYNVPLQPARPFCIIDYAGPNTKCRNLNGNLVKYERELKVPYYLVLLPEEPGLMLYRHGGRKYGLVKPDKRGRCAVPDLNLEIGIEERWARFWHRGRLLPLPTDLQDELDVAQEELLGVQAL